MHRPDQPGRAVTPIWLRLTLLGLLIAAGGVAAAGAPAYAQDAKRQQLLKQQELRKQKIIEQQRKLRESLKSDSAGTATGGHEEAQAIYNNLRLRQNLSHDDAIARLKDAGFPTDRIKALP